MMFKCASGSPTPEPALTFALAGGGGEEAVEVSRHAILVADLLNDGRNVLAVAPRHGDLVIYEKLASNGWPRRRYRHLGHVTALAAGDLFSTGRNLLVAICSEGGWIHLIDLAKEDQYAAESEESSPSVDQVNNMQDTEEGHPVFSQRILPNIHQACVIRAIDGSPALAVAMTDRVVRVYRWEQDKFACTGKFTMTGGVGSTCGWTSEDGRHSVLAGQPGGIVCALSREGVQEIFTPDSETDYVGSSQVLVDQNDHHFAVATSEGWLFKVNGGNQQVFSFNCRESLDVLRKVDWTGDGTEDILAASSHGYVRAKIAKAIKSNLFRYASSLKTAA